MKKFVVFINPPNTNDELLKTEVKTSVKRIIPISNSVTKGVEHTDWANFPHLGILSLASYIQNETEFEAVYFDCVVCPLSFVYSYLEQNREQVVAVCLSLLTANYEIGQTMARQIKRLDDSITVVAGNDHISAMYEEVFENAENYIDFGLVGNDCHKSLATLMSQLSQPRVVLIPEKIPALIYRYQHQTLKTPEKKEEIYTKIDYRLIDKVFEHSNSYTSNFQNRLGPTLARLLNRPVKKGVPIELARGCLKFCNNDPCSFCSIHHSGVWKNSVPSGEIAWEAIKNAHDNGYDYLYVTADELPLTFPKLIKDMHRTRPSWFLSLPDSKRPVLMGYGRADGMNNVCLMTKMREVGFRIIYIGIDAGAKKSLQALNKPLNNGRGMTRATLLNEQNKKALTNARKAGLIVKAGFVLGHLGMDQDLLDENLSNFVEIIREGQDSVVSVDVELLSPEPGSMEYNYLLSPQRAAEKAKELSLEISPESFLSSISEKYFGKDQFNREEGIEDYITAFMPRLDYSILVNARTYLRNECKKLGLVVGE